MSPTSSPIVHPNDPAWLQVAARELGQHEIPGAQDNPRILEYGTAVDLRVDHDEIPWCSCFVNWAMREAGYQRTRSALAASWLQYGMPAYDAARGAIVVLRRKGATSDVATGSATGNHVGFLLSTSRTYVEVLGGNQHDAVKVSQFPLDAYQVRGVRLPRACDRLVAPAPVAAAA